MIENHKNPLAPDVTDADVDALYEACITAALETNARLRHGRAAGDATDPVERMIATIEEESARIRAHDLGAVEAVFTSQALALDTLFTQLAAGSLVGDFLWSDALRLGLRAQAQSRATLHNLMSLRSPRSAGRSQRVEQNSRKRTVENGNSAAGANAWEHEPDADQMPGASGRQPTRNPSERTVENGNS